MKIYLNLIGIFFIYSVSFSQKIENKDYSEQLVNSEVVLDYLDKSKSLLDKFNETDFSKIWNYKPERDFNGIIGINHQRIRIHFSSVKKDSLKNYYIINGKTMVRTNICSFKGKLVIEKIYKLKYQDFESEGIKEYVIIGNYEFNENSIQYGSGIFKGKFATMFYIENNNIKYDNLKFSADSYTNNSFVGIWKSYKTGKMKICNWGESRIPFTNSDFDIGTGEMYISEKYHKFGWKSLVNYYSQNKTEESKKIEEKKWWK
jgi:hypothetical protein